MDPGGSVNEAGNAPSAQAAGEVVAEVVAVFAGQVVVPPTPLTAHLFKNLKNQVGTLIKKGFT